MKLIIVFLLLFTYSFSLHAKSFKSKCSLANSMEPMCYHKRDKPVLNVALMYYGASMKMEDLNRIEGILEERFFEATGGRVEVEIVDKKVIPFQKKLPQDYKNGSITDPKRLHRLWYYDNVNAKITQEVYEVYKSKTDKEKLNSLDALLTITGAQFQGLGFASGRVSVTEYPQEVAWSRDGGSTKYLSDYSLVDELIHELGHNMFLDHTSNQCQKIKMPARLVRQCAKADLSESERKQCRDLSSMYLRERGVCCDESPSKNDVMSYCRKRGSVSKNIMFGFSDCSRGIINNLVIPSLLKGGQWNVPGRVSCQ